MGKKYIKCPRCELNYILEGEEYCHVCKSEMKHHVEGDDDLLDEFEDMELCPVCGVNYIKEDQPMCEDCKKKKGQFSSDEDDDSMSKIWNKADDEDDSSIRSDIDIDSEKELDEKDYNSGFEEVDENDDPYKLDDDVMIIGDDMDSPIEFSDDDEEDENSEEDSEEKPIDDFEVVEVSDDDDDEEDEEENDDYDFGGAGDMLGKKK